MLVLLARSAVRRCVGGSWRRLASAPPTLPAPPAAHLVDATKRLRNLIDAKKLDKALDFFQDTFEQTEEDGDSSRSSRRSRGKATKAMVPDAIVFNSLVRGFIDAGRLPSAFDIVGWMQSKYRIQPTEVTWSLLMEGVAMHGARSDWRALLTLLEASHPSLGWRAPVLLDRPSFIKWFVRCAARLAYEVPEELRSAAVRMCHAPADSERALHRQDFGAVFNAMRPPAATSISGSKPPTKTGALDVLDLDWLTAGSNVSAVNELVSLWGFCSAHLYVTT
jgi:hypothetical protein